MQRSGSGALRFARALAVGLKMLNDADNEDSNDGAEAERLLEGKLE